MQDGFPHVSDNVTSLVPVQKVPEATISRGSRNTPDPFRLLDLPGEIRNTIYKFMLALQDVDGHPTQNAVGQTFFESMFERGFHPTTATKSSFRTAVPIQDGFYTPWTTWIYGTNSTGDDHLTFNKVPAILGVSKVIALEARGLWLKQPLFFELHDVKMWRDYKISSRVELMNKWVACQDRQAVRGIRSIRVAVNHEVEDDHGTEAVELTSTKSNSDLDTEDEDTPWLRCRRALFDIERTADSIIVRGGCRLREESDTKLCEKLAEVLKDKKSFSGEDLFVAAEAIETVSCVDELRLNAREEDCVTANKSDYYLSYREWRVIATVKISAETGDKSTVEADAKSEIP